MRGDMRALEEQVTLPQSNPVRGGSATPSMGLSQFRGGGDMTRMVGAGRRGKKAQHMMPDGTMMDGETHGGRNNKMEEAHRLGRALNLHLHSLHGAGYAKSFADGCSGGGFFDDIKGAFQKVGNEFTNPDSVLRRGATKVGHEFADPNSVLRGQVLPEAARYSAYAAPVLDVAGTAVGLPGAGTMLSRGLSAAQTANRTAREMGFGRARRGCGRERDDVAMMRGGRHMEEDSSSDSGSDYEGGQSFANPSSMAMSGAYQGQGKRAQKKKDDREHSTISKTRGAMNLMALKYPPVKITKALRSIVNVPAVEGKGRRRRAPAGANDGRRKRAEVVKRVMAEKGLKMIEASKYVKEHNLY